MSFKREYLEEKYKYLILKKKYKNLLGGASSEAGLFEHQRLCFVESNDIAKAREEANIILTEPDRELARELAKTKPGEPIWELTDPSKWPTSAPDSLKIAFLNGLKSADLKLYKNSSSSNRTLIACQQIVENVTANNDASKILTNVFLNDDTKSDKNICKNPFAVFGILTGDKQSILVFDKSTTKLKFQHMGGIDWGSETNGVRTYYIEKVSGGYKILIAGTVSEKLALKDTGLGIQLDGNDLIWSEATVFQIPALDALTTYTEASSTPTFTPPPPIKVARTLIACQQIVENVTANNDASKILTNVFLNDDTKSDKNICKNPFAVFGILTGDKQSILVFDKSTTKLKFQHMGGIDWGSETNGVRTYYIKKVSGGYKILIAGTVSKKIALKDRGVGIKLVGTDLTWGEATVFTIPALNALDTYKEGSSTRARAPPSDCDESTQHTLVTIRGNPWDDKFRIDPSTQDNYLQLSNETDYSQDVIAHFRTDHTTFPLKDIRSNSGNPNGLPSYNSPGHMDAHIQNLVIDGYPGIFILYNLLTTMFQEEFNKWLENKLGADWRGIDHYDGKEPWNIGTSQSHTYCPLINHFIKQKMPDLLTQDAVTNLTGANLYTAGGQYQQFRYNINHNADNTGYISTYTLADRSKRPINGNFNPLETQDAKVKFQEILNIMDMLIDPNTGVSFKRYLTYMLHYYPTPSESIPVGWQYRTNASDILNICPVPTWKPPPPNATIWSQEKRSYDSNADDHPITRYIRPSIYMLMIRSRDINATFEGPSNVLTHLLSGDSLLVTPIVTPCLADPRIFMNIYEALYKFDERTDRYNKTQPNAQNFFRISYAPPIVPLINLTSATFSLATSLNTMKAIEYSFKGNTMELL